MKKRKLKGYVLPTLYLLIAISIFVGVIFIGQDASLANKDYDYGTPTITDNVSSVVVEDTITSNVISSPIEEGKAEISVHYYSKDSEEEKQKVSLIVYENTYLPNTGLLYSSDEEFMVKPVFSGKVTEIIDNEFFGKVIVVEHSSNLRTYYYGLDAINVNVNDEVTIDTILGKSKNNEIMNDKKTFMLEVYHNNRLMDPEKFIGTKITDYYEN